MQVSRPPIYCIQLLVFKQLRSMQQNAQQTQRSNTILDLFLKHSYSLNSILLHSKHIQKNKL